MLTKPLKSLSRHSMWAWRYEVVHISPHGATTFTHRIFHKPVVTYAQNKESLKGRNFNAIYFDEAAVHVS